MSSPIPANPLEPRHLLNLMLILRRANARYQQIANGLRQAVSPTYHARRRASKLGLSIDIDKAAACPQTAISVIPLPVLDVSVSPTIELDDRNESPLRRRPALKCAIPPIIIPGINSLRRRGAHAPSSVESSPVAVAAAAYTLRDVNTPSSSCFSASPADAIPSAPADSLYSNERQSCAGGSEEEVYNRHLPDVPVEEDDLDWDLEYPNSEVFDVPLTPPSESDSSSAGPQTPEDLVPLVHHMKRKPSQMPVVDKPPKFARKNWSPIRR